MNHKHPKCKRGHRMVGKNLYVSPDGSRECRQCSLIRARRYKKAQRKLRISLKINSQSKG